MLANNLVWLHLNNHRYGAVPYLHQEGFITGIMFCHQTGGFGGLISGGLFLFCIYLFG